MPAAIATIGTAGLVVLYLMACSALALIAGGMCREGWR